MATSILICGKVETSTGKQKRFLRRKAGRTVRSDLRKRGIPKIATRKAGTKTEPTVKGALKTPIEFVAQRLKVEHDPGYSCIVAGGSWDESDLLHVRDSAFIVAADSGAWFLKSHGLVPDVIVGDFDSLDADTLEYFRNLGKGSRPEKTLTQDELHPGECLASNLSRTDERVEIVTLPCDKDKTDTEVALDIVLDRGFSTAIVIGALGGTRIDHEIANVFLIERYAKMGLDVILSSRNSVIFGLSGADSEYLAHKRRRWFIGKPGDWATIIPMTSQLCGVTTEGLRFPLYDAILERGATLGVSNEITQDEAAVSIAKGFCLVILTAK